MSLFMETYGTWHVVITVKNYKSDRVTVYVPSQRVGKCDLLPSNIQLA